MAKSNPNIPNVNITLQDPVTGLVLQGILEALPVPTVAGIFAPEATLQEIGGSGIYQNTGTTAAPVWRLNTPELTTVLTASLGTVQNSTPTAAQLLGGNVTQTSATAAGTVTTPTGTQLSAAIPGVAVNTSFDTLFSNLGGTFNLTITGGAGVTVLGNPVVPSGRTAKITFINTAVNTWTANVVVSA